MSEPGWFSELIFARKANHSNVFIIETSDPVVIENLSTLILGHPLFHESDVKALNAQTWTLVTLSRDGAPLAPPEQINPLQLHVVLDKLRKTKLVLLVYLLIRPNQIFEDFLVACSHDPRIYENKSSVVVVTHDLNVFPYVLRKLCYEITVPPPDDDERRKVIQHVVDRILSKDQSSGEEIKSMLPRLVHESRGLNLFEIQTALLRSYAKYRRLEVSEFAAMKKENLKSLGIDYLEAKRGFESVGGYEYLKQYFRSRLIRLLRNPEVAEAYGLRPPRGILLFGPPGTGKTWLAKALAGECGIPAVALDASTFLRGIVGETESRIRHVTRVLEAMAPVLVIIDEVDQLTLSRGSFMSTDSGVSRRMVNMLLSWMGDEDRRSIIVGTTNHLEDIDPAFLRPGRFDEIVPVLLPDYESRLQILKVHTSVVRNVPVEDETLKKVAEDTEGYTGAELEKLVIEAAFAALEQSSPTVEYDHFKKAMKAVHVNRDERMKKVEEMLRQASRLEAVNISLVTKAYQTFTSVTDSRIEGVIR